MARATREITLQHGMSATTTIGGSKWGGHSRGGCTGRSWSLGWFLPFLVSVRIPVGRRRTGTGYSRHWVVFPGRFHGFHSPGVMLTDLVMWQLHSVSCMS